MLLQILEKTNPMPEIITQKNMNKNILPTFHKRLEAAIFRSKEEHEDFPNVYFHGEKNCSIEEFIYHEVISLFSLPLLLQVLLSHHKK